MQCCWLTIQKQECANITSSTFCAECLPEKTFLYKEYKTKEKLLCNLFCTSEPPKITTVLPLLKEVIHLRLEFTQRLNPLLRDQGHEFHIMKLTSILQRYQEYLGSDSDSLQDSLDKILTDPFTQINITQIVILYLYNNNLIIGGYEESVLALDQVQIKQLWRAHGDELYLGGNNEFAIINNMSTFKFAKWLKKTTFLYPAAFANIKRYLQYQAVYGYNLTITPGIRSLITKLPKELKNIVAVNVARASIFISKIRGAEIQKDTALLLFTSRLERLRGIVMRNNVFILSMDEVTNAKDEAILMSMDLGILDMRLDPKITFSIVACPNLVTVLKSKLERQVNEMTSPDFLI